MAFPIFAGLRARTSTIAALADAPRVPRGETASGSDWIGLRSNGAYRVTAVEQHDLLPPWLALLLIGGTLLLAWRVEGG